MAPRTRWLFALCLLVGLLVGGAFWWQRTQVPAPRLVARYPHEQVSFVTPHLFFLFATEKEQLTLRAYDWAGHRLSSTAPLPRPPEGAVRDFTFFCSPNKRWMLSKLVQGDGTRAAWSLWRDGQLVRTEMLPACEYAEVRDDGTAWLFGSNGATLSVFTMQPRRTLAARTRVPYVSDDIYGFGCPILSCAIFPVNPVIPSWGGSPGSISADATTLTLDAYRRDGASHDTQMPGLVTYTLRLADGRLTLTLRGVKWKLLAPLTSCPPAMLPMPSPPAPKPPAPKPAIPDEARVIRADNSFWLIPAWRDYPEGWASSQSDGGRYAVVCYPDTPRNTTKVLGFLQRWLPMHNPSRDVTECIDLFEDPGVLRGRLRLPQPTGGIAKYQAPRDPALLLYLDGKTRLYAW
jgi:hypothetical protein